MATNSETRAAKQKLKARITRRKEAGKNTKAAEAKLAKLKGPGRGVGKSGAASKTSAERLQSRVDRRTAANKGTKRATRSLALKEKLAAANEGGKTKRAARLTSRIKDRATAARARRTTRKAAR